MINESSFYYLFKYDYYTFANILMNENDININKWFSESEEQLRWSKLVNFDGNYCDTIIYNGTSNKTPLFAAAEKENIDIIKLLLSNEEIDVNSCDIEEDTT
ncbi:hypothetical protein M9Y10_037139 [Tritrichomonas musculus]|uniref:Ankyrin repeat protein n=1 Tax=Tritrichomonas musculus TaxID=1915356 RepID=A0ABR2GU48_9EUKA